MPARDRKPRCIRVSPGAGEAGKSRLAYARGISAQSAGATGLCMHLVTLPPGARSTAHLHRHHETAVYVLSGEAGMEYGDGLGERLTVRAGEFVYVPASMPHVTFNASATEPCTAVIARTDPNDEESVEPYDADGATRARSSMHSHAHEHTHTHEHTHEDGTTHSHPHVHRHVHEHDHPAGADEGQHGHEHVPGQVHDHGPGHGHAH